MQHNGHKKLQVTPREPQRLPEIWVPSPLLGAAHWINRDSSSGPASSAYYTHNLSMPESVSFGHVLTTCCDLN